MRIANKSCKLIQSRVLANDFLLFWQCYEYSDTEYNILHVEGLPVSFLEIRPHKEGAFEDTDGRDAQVIKK